MELKPNSANNEGGGEKGRGVPEIWEGGRNSTIRKEKKKGRGLGGGVEGGFPHKSFEKDKRRKRAGLLGGGNL